MAKKRGVGLEALVGRQVFTVWTDMLGQLVPDGRTHPPSVVLTGMVRFEQDVSEDSRGQNNASDSIALIHDLRALVSAVLSTMECRSDTDILSVPSRYRGTPREWKMESRGTVPLYVASVGLAYILLSATVTLGAPAAGSSKEGGQTGALSESDLRAIEHGHYNSAGRALVRLGRIYRSGGAEALGFAVPAIASRTAAILRRGTRSSEGEGEGELLVELIYFLGLAGDLRSKPVLLEAMVSKKIGSSDIGTGLVKMGRSVIPEIIVLLKNSPALTRQRIARTLVQMDQMDRAYFPDGAREEIRRCLEDDMRANLGSERRGSIGWGIRFFGGFGDSTIVPVLERLAIEDPYVLRSTGEFVNRKAAEEAVERLRARLQKAGAIE